MGKSGLISRILTGRWGLTPYPLYPASFRRNDASCARGGDHEQGDAQVNYIDLDMLFFQLICDKLRRRIGNASETVRDSSGNDTEKIRKRYGKDSGHKQERKERKERKEKNPPVDQLLALLDGCCPPRSPPVEKALTPQPPLPPVREGAIMSKLMLKLMCIYLGNR